MKPELPIPPLARAILRGVGQVFFQDSEVTGLIFLVAIAISSPAMAVAALAGSVVGTLVAKGLKYDAGEVDAGIYGFNATLVGIATLFFFETGAVAVVLGLIGCVVATIATYGVRRSVPFPTYTTPFIVTTWILYLLGPALGATKIVGEANPDVVSTARLVSVETISHGVSQVMFQANIWTGVLFLIGIAVCTRSHAVWVLIGSIVGMIVGSYHATAASKGLDVERLIERALIDNIALGLYGYNATLAAVALWLWRPGILPCVLGMILAVLLTEFIPNLGLPALTAPFVLASWIVIALGSLEQKLIVSSSSKPS